MIKQQIYRYKMYGILKMFSFMTEPIPTLYGENQEKCFSGGTVFQQLQLVTIGYRNFLLFNPFFNIRIRNVHLQNHRPVFIFTNESVARIGEGNRIEACLGNRFIKCIRDLSDFITLVPSRYIFHCEFSQSFIVSDRIQV